MCLMEKGDRKEEEISGTIQSSSNLTSESNAGANSAPHLIAEDLWFSTFNAVEDAISILDDNFRIVRCNKAMQRLTGFSNEALAGKRCFEIVHHDQQPFPDCPFLKTKQTLRRETKEVLLGNRWVDITIDPLISPEGKITGAVQIIRDITERKGIEEKLRESELRAKQRLETMLSPDLDVGDLELADIIDSEEIQAVMKHFFKVTNICIGIVDMKGKVLVANGWQDICTCFHRVHPETSRNCLESDTILSLPDSNNPQKFKAYKCKNNMWDISTPIIVGGKHLGNIFVGQFFYEDEKPDYELYRKQAQKYGFNEHDYIEAVNKVPRLTHEMIEAVMNFYSRLSSLISNLSYVNLKLSKTIEERNKAVDELRSKYSLLRMAGKVARFGGWNLNLDENRVIWSDEVCLIHEMPLGYTPTLSEGLNFYAPEYRKKIEDLVSDCRKNGIAYDAELEINTASGKRIWVRATGEPVRDENGRIHAIEGAFQNIHDRKIMEKALRESEGNARAIMESTDDVIVLLKRDGTVIDSNEGHARKLGYTRADLIGKNVFLFLPPEAANRRMAFLQTVLDTGKPFYGEDCRDNVWTEISIHPIFDDKEEIDRVAIFGHDITARKQTEDALRKSEELLTLFMKYSPVYTFIKRVTPTESTVIRASENYIEMIGIPGSQMEGKNMFELFPGEFAKKITNDDWEAVENGKILVLDEELNGKFYTTIKFPISADGKSLLAGFTIDDTERKRVEKEVKRMNSLLAATLESTNDAILVVDRLGKVSNFNKKFIELWRLPDNNILNEDDKSLIDLVLAQLKDPESFIEKTAELYRKEENSFDIIEFADGRMYERYSQAQRLEGEVIGKVWSFRDITTRMQAENALKENELRLVELNSTKDRLFSIVAHDLRNPFNSVVGFSGLLSAEVSEQDYSNVDRYARIIQDSSEKALDLLQNLLEWSRSQTGRLSFNPEEFDMCVQINQTTELLISSAMQKSISLQMHTPRTLWVQADKVMINIILRNLISNAIKFTRPGGQIEISATQSAEDLVVSVADNGVGIPEEVISKLFRIDTTHSTFGTQNEKGSGLGLILCKELIDKHNGQIWVESKKGEGSTFYFSIPLKIK